jgi:3-oxoacyl-(acyl-carrier-protein) synthase
MKGSIYIKAASCISPQHSYEPGMFLEPVMSSDSGRLYVVEQDYRKYISPVAIRRMSRLLKMSITAGMQCLADAGVLPDAIITGTGRGSVSDMEHFLRDMIEMKEEALNPTYFIQSTYNSVNGWLALQTKCTCYNQTYVHRGLSFELALLDGMLTLDEAEGARNVLVGGFDEMTDYYHFVKNKIGYWKQEKINSLELLKHKDSAGTIGGEGAGFFVLTNERGDAKVAVAGVQALHKPGLEELQAAVTALLEKNGLGIGDIDVLLSGMNGSLGLQPLCEGTACMLEPHTIIAGYKHLSGDFDTAPGFGLWLANYMLVNQKVPEITIVKEGTVTAIENLLIVNHAVSGDASVMLLQLCK